LHNEILISAIKNDSDNSLAIISTLNFSSKIKKITVSKKDSEVYCVDSEQIDHSSTNDLFFTNITFDFLACTIFT